jgi:hypothetical protein
MTYPERFMPNIFFAERSFVGPYPIGSSVIVDRPGVFIIADRPGIDYSVIDVDHAALMGEAILSHPRRREWETRSKLPMVFLLYTLGSEAKDRFQISQDLRESMKPLCGS